MFQMDPDKLPAFFSLLQSVCGPMTVDVPDTPEITFEDEELWFDSLVWTSAMTRDRLTVGLCAGEVSARTTAIDTTEPSSRAAAMVIDKLFGPTLQVQDNRWIVAREEGLIRNGTLYDLDSNDMLIDRTLASLMEREMFDFKLAAESVTRELNLQIGDELPTVPVGRTDDFSLSVFARQRGLELPIIGSWVTLNEEPYISFDGSFIALNWQFSETLRNAAAGRRVEEIIETGIPSLDKRLIKTIHKKSERTHGSTEWDVGLPDYIELASDTIRLGSCPD